ncbi:hypothetical protein HYV81_02735 [Candidatus Woesearchaeota archaeon]|nr:hypothetical protein [Candidatus Woesearchaeota archaeon]
MDLNDILNNAKADRELRNRSKPKQRVTQEEHEKYVQERLFEAGAKLDEIFSSIPEPGDDCGYTEIERFMDKFTAKAMEVVRDLSVAPSSKDLSRFCTTEEFRTLEETDSIGLFVSFLINAFHTDAAPLIVDLRNAPLVDSFGYKLGKDVVVQGNLGDFPAMFMEAGKLIVEGRCGANVGMYMKGGTVYVRGTIGHVGIIRYGGKIIHRGITMEPDEISKHDLIELLRVHQHDYRLARLYRELTSREPALLDQQFKEMLHPALLEPVCRHNHEIYQGRGEEYERQGRSLLARAQALEEEYRDKRWSKKGQYLAETGVAASITMAIPILAFVTVPYFLYRTKKTANNVDRVVEEEERAVKDVESELSNISSKVDDNNRAAIDNLEFYLSLPGVHNPEMRRQLEAARSELGIR